MNILIKNARIINESQDFEGYILIKNQKIEKIGEQKWEGNEASFTKVIDARGKIAIPGVIDDQVHFREPGLTHKAELATESAAAVAGGITSFMEMPNTNPQTVTQQALTDKFALAAEKSLANFSFYMGATNDNLDEILKTDPKTTAGIKVFMGASTGNMLVDDLKTLQGIFAEAPTLIATHCEDEATIRQNMALFQQKYGEDILPEHHPLIRSAEACYKSSSQAIELATQYNTQLHILHISTEKELALFQTGRIEDKRITAEVCVHHLWFDSADYLTHGHRIKWNPAVKQKSDKEALMQGLLSDKLDVIATDHAPHLLSEKLNQYTKSASGGPLVQHSLLAMLDFYHQGKITLEQLVHKMSHAPATLYKVNQRGYLREGYYADIVLADLNGKTAVNQDNLLYKCGWSPFEGHEFKAAITHTFVNGSLVYENGHIHKEIKGEALTFNR